MLPIGIHLFKHVNVLGHNGLLTVIRRDLDIALARGLIFSAFGAQKQPAIPDAGDSPSSSSGS